MSVDTTNSAMVSSTIPLSPVSTLSVLCAVFHHRAAVLFTLLLSFCHQPLYKGLPHHIVDAFRFAQLLSEASHFAFQLSHTRLQRHSRRCWPCSNRFDEVCVVLNELFSRIGAECARKCLMCNQYCNSNRSKPDNTYYRLWQEQRYVVRFSSFRVPYSLEGRHWTDGDVLFHISRSASSQRRIDVSYKVWRS